MMTKLGCPIFRDRKWGNLTYTEWIEECFSIGECQLYVCSKPKANFTRIPSRIAATVRGIQCSQLSHLQPPTLDRSSLDVPRPISHHSPCHSARMIAILASGGKVIPLSWKCGSAFENKVAQVSGSRSLALLKAFIEMSISL